MPCYQSTNLPGGVTTTGRTSYTTEAACLNACKEGACCEGTVCSVKPACQCQGTGKTFKGVGTVCTPNPCCGGCFVSIGAKVPSSASGVGSAGTVLTRGSACNCEVPGYPYFYIGLLCTSSGMRVNVMFWPDAAGLPLSRLWSPLLSLTIPADCSGVTYATQCASNVGAERVNCGANGWPTTTTTFTRSDFSDVAASWGPIPYASLSAGNKSIFDAYFPEFVSVYPSANPLP
jgi:hypothetical protein